MIELSIGAETDWGRVTGKITLSGIQYYWITSQSGVLKLFSIARDGYEAQRGLNDIWPGDPYPPAETAEKKLSRGDDR